MKKTILALALIICCSSFSGPTLTGTWIFAGGIYNGKKEGATKDYTLKRIYQSGKFNAFVIEKGVKPQKYQSGTYQLKKDTCLETETYSAQPSRMTGKVMHYQYTLRHDSLILRGILPTGMKVEEYWKKVK